MPAQIGSVLGSCSSEMVNNEEGWSNPSRDYAHLELSAFSTEEAEKDNSNQNFPPKNSVEIILNVKPRKGQGMALLQGLWLSQSWPLEYMLNLSLVLLSVVFITLIHTSCNYLF